MVVIQEIMCLKKDGAYVINLDEHESIETYWIALYLNGENVTYLDFLELNIFQEKLKKLIRDKDITTNIYRMQAYNSVMCRYFCIGFIDFKLKGKGLLDYTNLFSSNKYEKNDKIILICFSITRKD